MTHNPEQDGQEPPNDEPLLESGSSADKRALRRSGPIPTIGLEDDRPRDDERLGSEDPAPPAFSHPVWIVLELPEEELGGAFATRLGGAGFKSQIHHPTIFVRHAVVEPEPLAAMMEDLVGRSLTGAKMTVVTGLGEPSLTEILTQLVPMGAFVARLESQWLMPFIVSGGVFALLQPIRTASDERWGHDALVRVSAPRARMLGADIVRAAQGLDLAQVVDRLARIAAFTSLSNAPPEAGRLVLHASQATFAELHGLERSLLELTRRHEIGLERLVVNAPWASCEDAVAIGRAFHALRGLGVTLSVGGGPRAEEIVGPEDLVSLVRELDADIVRVPAVTPDDALGEVARRLAGSKVLVHATHVGDAATAADARARGAHLVSGELFATAGSAVRAPT
jgi:hypothetical protein